MSSILSQNLLTLKQAAEILPNRPHTCSIWRWVQRGIKGHKLQSWIIGGVRYTSAEALESFIQATSGHTPKVVAEKSRAKQIAKADSELAGFGL